MTVKILDRGINPAEVPFQLMCVNCHTRIECLRSDMKVESASDMRETSYSYVPCPVCNTRLTDRNKC